MTLVLLTWCPDPTKPAPCSSMPCQPKPPPSGYPNWGSIAFDGTVDIQFNYQLQKPFVGIPTSCGGHTITFGPHGLPDPGYWFQAPYVPPGSGDVFTFFTTVNVFIKNGKSATLPNTPFGGSDPISVQAADLSAQWQGYDFAVANPP